MPGADQLAQKSAVLFAKEGRAVYHSHHDLLRFWERAARRADLPVRLTRGFNPRPRIIFPHALGLGISSRVEVVEIELRARVDHRELRERLIRASAGTLEILGVENLPPLRHSRQITSSSYMVTGWSRPVREELARAAEDILARRELLVERGAPGERRKVDIRPFIVKMTVADNSLELEIRHTPAGSARPDEVTGLAAEILGTDRRNLRIRKTAMRLEWSGNPAAKSERRRNASG